jgi:hypothetical protein
MKGLGVRVAKGLNTLMKKKGPVWADRYHEHILKTPSEVKRAVHYVRRNYEKHTRKLGQGQFDWYSSAALHARCLVTPAQTWLLRHVAVSNAS